MKKILTVLTLLTVLTYVAVPVALAQEDGDATQIPESCEINDTRLDRITEGTNLECDSTCNYDVADCGMCCVLNTVYTVTDWIFFAIITIAVVFILVGGFMFVTAGGNAEKTMAGRNYLMMAAVGILIALLARAIPAIVKMVVGA
ncbi:MAG: hypothetical protein V1756_01230 [Patescibacteria group bacterium]